MKKSDSLTMKAQSIDASCPTYTNCTFFNIDNMSTQSQDKTKSIDVNERKKQIIDYVATTTGFSEELVERVIDTIELYFNKQNEEN